VSHQSKLCIVDILATFFAYLMNICHMFYCKLTAIDIILALWYW